MVKLHTSERRITNDKPIKLVYYKTHYIESFIILCRNRNRTTPHHSAIPCFNIVSTVFHRYTIASINNNLDEMVLHPGMLFCLSRSMFIKTFGKLNKTKRLNRNKLCKRVNEVLIMQHNKIISNHAIMDCLLLLIGQTLKYIIDEIDQSTTLNLELKQRMGIIVQCVGPSGWTNNNKVINTN